MVERYPVMSDEAEDSQVVGEFVRYADYAKLEEALRECVKAYDKNLIFEAFPDNPFSASIQKAREVLGDE